MKVDIFIFGDLTDYTLVRLMYQLPLVQIELFPLKDALVSTVFPFASYQVITEHITL